MIGEVNGIKYHITNKNDTIQTEILENRQWDNHVVEWAKDYISKKNCKHILNIGSHIGIVCLPLSKCIEKITAIEAYPPTFKYLCSNIELNNITNITLINIAMGNSDEDVWFMAEDKICSVEHHNRVENNSGGMHVFTENDIQNNKRSSHLTDKKIKGIMTKLDNTDIDNFDILIIDVEGSEYECLKGAKEKIMKNKPYIIIEIWDDDKMRRENMGIKRSTIIDFITSMNYKLVKTMYDDFFFEPI
jgi:FkbM family methyltransferase